MKDFVRDSIVLLYNMFQAWKWGLVFFGLASKVSTPEFQDIYQTNELW